MDVLIHISQQLSNSTTPAYTPAEFTVSPGTAAVNVLFFLSLALVLIDAFLAMLVKSWLQEFDRGWRKYTVSNLRAQERERRLQGLERWKLAELVSLLPILIQVSLLLFCIGLIVLLFPVHLISAIFSSVALLAGLTFYVFTTCVSIFDAYAPFSSPVSRGVTILLNGLQTPWMTLTHNVWNIISHVLFHISCPLSPREHEKTSKPSRQSLPGKGGVTRSPSPVGSKAVEKRGVVGQSHLQIDYQTYASILERLVTMTAEVVENIPVFLDLLDQPVKHLILRPSNVDKWKKLLHTTVHLLGDPSTFSELAARTIARNVIFCHGDGPAYWRLSHSLHYHFSHMKPGQTDRYTSLNSLFAYYLQDHFRHRRSHLLGVISTITSLEPSNLADVELLWMVNTIHKIILQENHLPIIYHRSLQFFAAVLTYVSSTEQSRRSQVPLTASVIYAMHTIKSAVDTDSIRSIDRPYLLPGTALTTAESMFETFYEEGPLDLWSDECVKLASALLQPPPHWPNPHDEDGMSQSNVHGPYALDIWAFQLPLIAALYIDSTKASAHPSTAFERLLSCTNITDVTETTWKWANVYDQTKLAFYWYMAIFREPIHHMHSPTEDINTVIRHTLEHCSEIRLSSLHLLDNSIKTLCAIFSPSDFLPTEIPVYDGTLPPWLMLHLDTFFPQISLSQLIELDLEQLEWTGSPEQVHIAMARLACYEPLKGLDGKEAEQRKPDSYLLKLFLWSTNYAVCTRAFKCCLNLATFDQQSSAEDIHRTGVFISEVMGHQWIEHMMHVLCGTDEGVWEFLAQNLVPKWDKLPPSWCCEFALVFLFSIVHVPDMQEAPAYQHIANALESYQMPSLLLFLGAIFELIKHSLDSEQLNSLETWLAQLPDHIKNLDSHQKLENALAMWRQHIADEALGNFAELPMNYVELMNDVQ